MIVCVVYHTTANRPAEITYIPLCDQVQSNLDLGYWLSSLMPWWSPQVISTWNQWKNLTDRNHLKQDIEQDWFHQFISNECSNQLTLANKINNFLKVWQSTSIHFKAQSPLLMRYHQNSNLVSEVEVFKALSAVKIGKVHTVGPDLTPNKVLTEFATEPQL